MPTPRPPMRPPWRVLLVFLTVFTAFGVVSRLTSRDATGRAVGGKGCADAEDPEGRLDLTEELDRRLGDRSSWLLPEPPTDGDWSATPQAADNPMSDAKVALGKELFYETGLMMPQQDAFKQTASCATCHDPRASFGSGTVMGPGLGSGGVGRGADRELAAGIEPGEEDLGPFNERRLVNVAFTAQFAGWQGDFSDENRPGLDGLESFLLTALISHEVLAQPTDPREWAAIPEGSVLDGHAYDALFEAAWPDLPPNERISQMTVTMALACYVRSINTWDAPFQRYLRGEASDDGGDPLSADALRGAVVFFGEGRCAVCHTGPALASPSFHTLGTRRLGFDREYPGYRPTAPEGAHGWGTLRQYLVQTGSGRDNHGHFVVSGDTADIGAFLVPSVYGAGNPNLLAFGHGGDHETLADFLTHKVSGNDPTKNPTLDLDLLPYLDPVLFDTAERWLTDAQITDLVAFIEEGLEDPGLAARHEPPGHLSYAGFCTPNNDPVSRAAFPECADARVWTPPE